MELSGTKPPAECGDILDNRWELLKAIGKGSFAEVFHARDIFDGKQVAIKVSRGTECPLMKENDTLVAMANYHGNDSSSRTCETENIRNENRFPNVLSYVHRDGELEYIVMELLLGEDMAVVRDATRRALSSSSTTLSPHRNHPLPLAGASHLAREMVLCIQDLHAAGFVHRDIKPANFVRRHCETASSDDLKFCLLDFGIAKVLGPEHNDGQGGVAKSNSRGRQTSRGFRGTTTYASVAAHAHDPQGRKDDLWSLLFVFVDLLVGCLPWTEAARSWQSKKNKPVQCESVGCSSVQTQNVDDNDECNDNEGGPSKKQRVGVVDTSKTFKEAVFDSKKYYTAPVAEKEKNEGSGNAALTRWVLEEMKLDLHGEVVDEIRLNALQDCLDTFITHLQELDTSSIPNYQLLTECLQSVISLCSCSSEVISQQHETNSLGLVWRTTGPSADSLRDQSDELDNGNARSCSSSRLRRHPLSVYDHSSSVRRSNQCASVGKKKNNTARILHLRSVKLAQSVAAFSLQHGNTSEIFQLPHCDGNDREAVVLDVLAFACEWFVLAEASLLLSDTGSCGRSSETSTTAVVDWRVLQPLWEVVDKLDLFVELGLYLQASAALTAASATASEQQQSMSESRRGVGSAKLSMEWTDFVELQEMIFRIGALRKLVTRRDMEISSFSSTNKMSEGED